MARARREWSAILAEIRLMLRESSAATSYWTDAQLLLLFNLHMDRRALQLQNAVEGYFTDSAAQNIVAGTASYALPEGTGRPRRIMIRRTSGGNTVDIPIERNERWTQPSYSSTTGVDYTYCLPTFKFHGANVILSPTPNVSMTNGLVIEFECLPARVTSAGGEASKLHLAFPDIAETLLTYDTVVAAFDMESAQNDLAPEYTAGIRLTHSLLSSNWDDYIELRTQGSTVRSAPLHFGD
jgi:hypothetical protein